MVGPPFTLVSVKVTTISAARAAEGRKSAIIANAVSAALSFDFMSRSPLSKTGCYAGRIRQSSAVVATSREDHHSPR
jgi:hypothetical protein